MATLGQQVLNHDRIILEQEWYFLASTSPSNTTMFKSVDNSDDAMTTKIDLFKPSEDCIWKLHIVELPTFNNNHEKERMQQLLRAEETIELSKAGRKHKEGALLCSLKSQLKPELKEDNVVKTKLMVRVTDLFLS